MKDGKYVIECVDDDPEILSFMRTVLSSMGYVVAEADSAEAGLKQFKSSNPDLFIVDLMMEEIDSGMGLVKELKLAGNKSPVIMLSSAGDELSTIADYSTLGLDGVLQKPIDPNGLVDLVQKKLK